MRARIKHMHPIAAIADRIQTAELLATAHRLTMPPESDEPALDAAQEDAKNEIELVTQGCDELLELLVGLVPYPADDYAKAMLMVERLVLSSMALESPPESFEVDAVCVRLFEIANAATRLEGAKKRKPNRSGKRPTLGRKRAAYTLNARKAAAQLAVVPAHRGISSKELARTAKIASGSVNAAVKQLGGLVTNTRGEGFAPADDHARSILGRIGSA